MYSLLLFVVIVWPTEMVISINQRIFFPRKGVVGRGFGERTWNGGKAKRRLLHPQQVEYPEHLEGAGCGDKDQNLCHL